jgi:hypothetical protein
MDRWPPPAAQQIILPMNYSIVLYMWVDALLNGGGWG